LPEAGKLNAPAQMSSCLSLIRENKTERDVFFLHYALRRSARFLPDVVRYKIAAFNPVEFHPLTLLRVKIKREKQKEEDALVRWLIILFFLSKIKRGRQKLRN